MERIYNKKKHPISAYLKDMQVGDYVHLKQTEFESATVRNICSLSNSALSHDSSTFSKPFRVSVEVRKGYITVYRQC